LSVLLGIPEFHQRLKDPCLDQLMNRPKKKAFEWNDCFGVYIAFKSSK
jgi:hypothetical protein